MTRGRIRTIFLDHEIIRRMYVEDGVSTNGIAEHFGVSQPTIFTHLAEIGVEIRRGGNRKGCKLPLRRTIDERELRRLYVEELWPSNRLAEHFGCSSPTILARLRSLGIAVRHHNDTKRGEPARNRFTMDGSAVRRFYAGDPSRSIAEVSRQFSVSKQVIRRVLDEEGVSIKPLSQVIEGKRLGAANPNWRDDLTPAERLSRRDTAKQAKWREAVYLRDGFTCQSCADATGGNLNAHHIEGHSENKPLRWSVDNGITLCAPCHREFHRRFGLKGFSRDDLTVFIADAALQHAA